MKLLLVFVSLTVIHAVSSLHQTSDPLRRRAETASSLYSDHAVLIGMVQDDEQLPGWVVFQAVLQDGAKFHEIKVCVPEDDRQEAVVLEMDKTCQSLVSTETAPQLQRAADMAADLARQLRGLVRPRTVSWAD